MKQLKQCCLQTIVKQTEPSAGVVNPSTSFQNVYTQLPEILSKANKEGLSKAVAFYSILHLANDHSLQLKSLNKKDFEIVPPPKKK